LFWSDEVDIPAYACWVAEHAGDVAAKRAENPKQWTHDPLSKHFKVSIPTIRKSLRVAAGKLPAPARRRKGTTSGRPAATAKAQRSVQAGPVEPPRT
jgi:hypothetical protein